MNRLLNRLCRTVGVAMVMGFSASASAQTFSCDAFTCSYGPICPDGWGGCYFYTWAIGSAKNTWVENKGGISNVVGLCDPSKPETCVTLTSKVELVTNEGGYNNLAICKVPGAQTCKGKQCGGSPDSSGASFKNLVLTTSLTIPVDQSSCTKEDKGKGGVKCSKTVTLTGPENQVDTSGQFCTNANWVVTKWIPLNFTGTMILKGPASPSNPLNTATTTTQAQCWWKDPLFRKPSDPAYALDVNDFSKNHLVCEHLDDANL